MGQKKPSYNNYIKWIRDVHGVIINEGEKKYYETVSNVIKEDFEKSSFWVELVSKLNKFETEYESLTGYELGILNFKPTLKVKEFDSVLEKSFRKNIKMNRIWPNEPKNGWIFPNNFYSKINDVVRTSLIVRYLDGIEFMSGKIHDLSNKHGLTFEKHQEARNEGYYAIHTYIGGKYEIPERKGYNTETIDVKIEIQLTTQLKEVIRTIIHEYYKDNRIKYAEKDMQWAWNYEGEEFAVNYLGHKLHYLEGMIMNIRKER